MENPKPRKSIRISTDAAPYPNISSECRDPELCRELLPLIAEKLASLAEYLYCSVTLEPAYPRLAELLSVLSEVELCHLGLLSRLSVAYGGNPTVRSLIRTSGSIELREDRDSRAPVAAARALRDLISCARRRAISYRRLSLSAERRGSISAAELLRRLAADEERHIRLLDDKELVRCSR